MNNCKNLLKPNALKIRVTKDLIDQIELEFVQVLFGLLQLN